MLESDRFPPVQALALNTSVPGLWRFANHALLKSWRAGSEVPAAPNSFISTTAAEDQPSLFRDLPELVLVAVLQHLDQQSLCAISQTCRAAFILASKRSRLLPSFEES